MSYDTAMSIGRKPLISYYNSGLDPYVATMGISSWCGIVGNVIKIDSHITSTWSSEIQRKIFSVHEDQDEERRDRAWRVYLSANVQLMERLDQELQQRAHLNLTDYEILSVLSEAPERRLRMSDLARQVLVSRSRLTYRVDRLAEVDFVTREECEDDRRGLWAILTEEGANALGGAKAGHDRDINNWFFDLMSPDELAMLGNVMSRIEAKLTNNRTRQGL